MLRSILAVVAGIFVGAVVIFFVEGLGHMIFPPPDGVDLNDPEQLKSIMKDIPLGAKLAVLAAWGAGVFAGGVAALLIARRWAPVAWVVAATLFTLAGVTMMAIAHPWWMVAGAVLVTCAGAVAAIKLLRASYARPVHATNEPFAH